MFLDSLEESKVVDSNVGVELLQRSTILARQVKVIQSNVLTKSIAVGGLGNDGNAKREQIS